MNNGNAPVIQAYLAANPYQAPQTQPSAPQSHGNFLTHLLPALGGTLGGVSGGALGGAEIGTALLPGIGTAAGGLLGALLGGAAGGAAGKVAENAKEKQKLTNGVAGQALEQGILSAGPLRLLKGVGAAGAATGRAVATAGETAGGNTLVDALNAAGNAAMKSGVKAGVAKTAVSTLKTGTADNSAAGFGIGVGQKVNGNLITPNQSDALQNFLQNRANLYGGIKPGTPIQQATQAQAVHDAVTNALSSKLDQINRAVTPEETQGIANTALQAASKNPALADSSLAPLSALSQQITGATDLKGLEAARMAADKLAYPNGTDLASSQLAQQGAHVRDAIDKFVSQAPKGATPEQQAAINEYKAIKGDYGASKDLLSATSQANAGAKGVHIPFLGGEVGRQTVNGAKNVANAKLAGVAGNAGNAAAPFGTKAIASRVIGGNALIDALTGAQGQNSTSQNQPPPADLTTAITQAQQGNNAGTQDTTNPFSQQNIEGAIANDIATTGGKNITQLLALYNTFGKPDATQQTLTTNQKNEVVSQQKALESLNAYTTQLQNAGGPEGPVQGAINGSILGNFTNPAAKGIDAQRIDVASAIAGSLSPRGTVSPVTARIISEALPSIHDSPKVAQAKIANLVAQIKAGAYSADTPVSTLVSGNAGQ